MPPKDQYVFSDFSGGLNQRAADKLAPNEAAVLQNLIPIEGNLISYPGNVRTSTGVGSINGNKEAFQRLYAASTQYSIIAEDGDVHIDTGATTNRWRPIYSQADRITALVPLGEKLYISTNGAINYRWDKYYYITGTAACAGGTATVTGTGTAWSGSLILPGDTIYFRPADDWWTAAYYVESVDSTTQITLTGNGPNTGGSVDYIIVRTHPVGIPAPSQALTGNAVTGTGLGTGVYKYLFTYGNSHTGVESNFVSTPLTVTTTGADAIVDLGNLNQTPPQLQIDKIYIYRTLVGGSIYYYLDYITRDQAGYTFTDEYIDNNADSTLDTTRTLPTSHDMPPGGTTFHLWKDRLYGFGVSGTIDVATYPAADVVEGQNQLCFSTLGYPEYWPRTNFGTVDAISIDPTLGGYVTVGSMNAPIVSVCGEGLSSDNTYASQSTLLVLKRGDKSYRWHGSNWNDFQLNEAVDTDCVSNTAVNSSGLLAWISSNGPVVLTAGASKVVPIYEKIWPSGSNPFYQAMDLTDTGKPWRMTAKAWRDYILFSVPAVPTDGFPSNNNTYVFHVPSGTWFHMLYGFSAFEVYDSLPDDGSLYAMNYAAEQVKMFTKTSTSTYWTGTTGVSWLYVSPLFGINGNRKHVGEVRVFLRNPLVQQTLSMQIVPDGGTPQTALTKTIPANSNPNRVVARFNPNCHAMGFQVMLSGTWTSQAIIDKIEVDLVDDGKSTGI